MQDQYGINHYQKVGVETRVSSSDPHSLVAMLFDGLLEKLARASGAITRGNVSEKGEALGAGIKIIDGLRASLDYEKGGEIASNLGAMYDYMERRLLEASTKSDAAIVAEVVSLVKQVKDGWDAIPSESRGA
ncbi:MAG: flagellar export chaperone FliS [Gammaproteobacteria bacterium]|nr:flagellar export chaperone FliS [Gammaproteobacteria bacterium]